MAILEYQVVRMKWSGANKKIYESKGYLFTKIGDTFDLMVKDLSEGSDILVEYICDYCNGTNQVKEEQKRKRYQNLVRYRKNGINKDCCGHIECKKMKMKESHDSKNIEIEDSLGERFPHLIKEWNFEKNTKTPFDYKYGSNKVVWWKCDKGHEWEIRICSRSISNSNCPYCSGKYASDTYNLTLSFPHLIKEWHPDNEFPPYEYTPHSSHKVKWIGSCGHEWYATISNRSNGRGCPYCSGKQVSLGTSLGDTFPELIKEWNFEKNKEYSPNEILPKSNKKAWWKCIICNCEWSTRISDRTSNGKGCPSCAESKGEKGIRRWLDERDIILEAQKEFSGLIGLGGGNLSYDFYIPSHNLLIEYQGEFHDGNGNYFMKENLEKQQEHDRRKREYAEQNGIKLLEIWYWDFDRIEEILNKELTLYNFN